MEESKQKEEKDYRLFRLFSASLRQYFESTSLHGFKYLVQSKADRFTFEKLFWYGVQICALAGASYIFVYAFDGFVAKPTVTSLESVDYPIWELPYPAVAICSANKISKKAAMNYAIELSKRTNNHSVEWLFKNIRYLGHVFDFDLRSFDNYIIFQDLLDIIDVNNETNLFDTQEKFEFRLTPQCEDLFVRCRFGFAEIECMKLFKFRKTRHGYCCLFNYVRQFSTLSTQNVEKPRKAEFITSSTGLTVILNATATDYYFSTGDHIGFNVFISNPSDFSDNQNGGVIHLLINAGKFTDFKLKTTTIQSKEAIEQYTPIQRGCLFEHELIDQYAGHYSFVDCLLKCKLRRLIQLCGCMPFFLPTNFPDGTFSPVKCTLAHNKCLDRHKSILNSYWIPNMIDFAKSFDDSIECLECLPICSKTNYRVLSSNFDLRANARTNLQFFRDLGNLEDISIMRVYFPYIDTTLYTADVLMTWQELLSNFGGLLGLCLGFSLVNIIEIVYFATVRVYQNIELIYDKKLFQWKLREKSATDDKIVPIQKQLFEIYKNDFKYFNYPINKSHSIE